MEHCYFDPAFSMNFTNVHAFFEHAVKRYPDNIAIVFKEQTITYSELNGKAESLGNIILSHPSGSNIIGVSTTRSIDTIIAVIAILKAGKAYLPLDPTHPKERLLYLIHDAGLQLCICSENERTTFASAKIELIIFNENYDERINNGYDSIINPPVISDSLAYVLYTSGSSGMPKGVCMGHKALVNLLQWQAKNSAAGAATKTLQFAPLTFDVSFQEIFSTLTTGGTLVLIEEEIRIDPDLLLAYLEQHKINRVFVPFVALQYLTEAASASNYFPRSLQEVITAGEQLQITPAVIRFFNQLPGCILINQYGPTECHVVTANKLSGNAASWPKLPGIGKAIDHTEILILDENLNELPFGETGELCVSGVSLADGYLNNKKLTDQKFIYLNNLEGSVTRIYLTGDLARFAEDENIEYLGRKDDQVKINGVRIELGEIEVQLNQCPGVKQAVVAASENGTSQKRLTAYLVSVNDKKNTPAIKEILAKILPEYLLPSMYVWLKDLPKTASGKIDRKALPQPATDRPEMSVLYKAPETIAEKRIISVWEKLIGINKIGIDDNFFELGGNSLLAVKTAATLREEFNYIVPVTKLYQFPTISEIAVYLDGNSTKKTAASVSKPALTNSNDDIVVIGMSVRFPGANTIDELWNILTEEKETTTFFKKEDLSPFISETIKNDTDYVKARGIIDNVKEFDYAFFGINPKTAALMDPQHRIFLEIAWEVLEQTGHLPQQYDGIIGVYAGCGNNTYYLNNVLPNPEIVEQAGHFNVMTLNEKDYIASRTAYELNVKGPAISIFSACSTSLLAVAQAADSIRQGYCAVAIAGGASITSPVESGHLYHEGGILSKDGHCRPFDSEASGTVFSDGAGVVLLKSLQAAERDGDTIYGVIKGIGLNNDGSGKGSFTAPNAVGQAAAISMAVNNAGIEASDISYIETHGTATPIGDPIEIAGLNLAFGRQEKKQFCAIGSIKSNMGHLTAASGIAGFIKTILSLHNKQIPATLFYNKANPNINFEHSPFYVNNTLAKWPTNKKRIAGISSFGVGGTNVHIIAEEYENKVRLSDVSRPLQLISWSAKSVESGSAYSLKLSNYLKQNNGLNLSDVCHSLHTSRIDFNHRCFALAATNSEAITTLSSDNLSAAEINVVREKTSEIVFLFPGQGSQYVDMGRQLYDNEPVYKNAIDECAALLEPYLEADIRKILFPENLSPEEAEQKINNTLYTQPAIFITEYALTRLWISWGIKPTILCGHSIGELVAAHFAGIFSLPDVLQFIAFRSKIISALPKGKMLSVRMEAEKLISILPAKLSIAAINNQKSCVVSGHSNEITTFSRFLDNEKIANRELNTSHAFHSSMMDSVAGDLGKKIGELTLHHPQKPVMSAITGSWLTDAEATDPAYWSHHVRKTVRFGDAIKSISENENIVFLDAGPGNVASSLVRQQLSGKKISVITSLEKSSESEYHSILKALGRLWLQGVTPDWKAFYSNQQRIHLPLPTYAFNKTYCWIDPPQANSLKATAQIVENKTICKTVKSNADMRKEVITEKIRQVIEDASGIEINAEMANISFLETGLDSLLLTQVAITLKKEFNLPVTFRQLQEESNTIDSLADYFISKLPADAYHSNTTAKIINIPVTAFFDTDNKDSEANEDNSLEAIKHQLHALSKQVAAMQSTRDLPATASSPVIENNITKDNLHLNTNELTPGELTEIKKPFGASPKIERKTAAFNSKQHAFLQQLTLRYNQKTNGSKKYSQENRLHMADPRVVTGFSPLTKELVYSIVVDRSKGSRIWDVDGNEYIDVLNGFGSNLFGYQPDFLKKAIYDQVEKGYELGPQHELAGEVSKMICDFTGLDRAAFCNTGSEAVLGAVRIARTVTGRSLIVAFSGSYHGIFDEVIVRGTRKLKAFPAAPGIMPEAVQNMLILDYGTDETLQIIKERAHELAAVLVEPVQSRRPEFTPVDFLKKVRKITAQSGAVLIFDEVITGFRMHPGGAQALFNISADLATYGKVIGGGLPIGVIAGKKQFMDALDGGFWQYGDNSFPETGVTYFAGTFVRHPLALATAKASLQYMKEKGPELQKNINSKATYLAVKLNTEMERRKLPMYVAFFGSLWKIKFKEEIPLYELIFTLMREKGIHIWDGFPCFMTEAHTRKDVDSIVTAFTESVDEMIAAGFYKNNLPDDNSADKKNNFLTAEEILPPDARLGRDKNGNPAWFISDPEQPGKYRQINSLKK